MKQMKRYGFTARFVILFGVMLLMTNVILGVVMMHQSNAAVEAMVRRNMQDMARIAASLMDGDVLGRLTENDIGSPAYKEQLGSLIAFQGNADIEYIYAVRQTGPGRFVFILDPDPEDPAAFGEEIIVTDGLRQAGAGTAAIDSEPVADEWGDFYSAYCPVYDSQGRVAAVIGVDFDAVWYDEQISQYALPLTVIVILFVFAGGLIVLVFSQSMFNRLQRLNGELSSLSSDVDELEMEILSNTGGRWGKPERYSSGTLSRVSEGDEIEELGAKIRQIREDVRDFLDYAHKMAYTDALTGVGNTRAYVDAQSGISRKIAEGGAVFHVAIFDINDLKKINDLCGHSTGDRIIRGAALVVEYAFGSEMTFRIGGDEFLAIIENASDTDIAQRMERLKEKIQAYNQANGSDGAGLSISKGSAAFRPGQDTSFRDVFVRADEEMYSEKSQFHRQSDQRPPAAE